MISSFKTRHPSFRNRLLVSILSLLSVLWAGMVYMNFEDAHRDIDALLDSSLARSARVLLRQALHEVRETGDLATGRSEMHHGGHLHIRHEGFPAEDASELLREFESQVLFQIYSDSGELLTRSSPGIPDHPMRKDSGFENFHDSAGTVWRIYSLWDWEHKLQVQVFLSHELGRSIARKIAYKIAIPLIFVLPFAALIIVLLTQIGFNRIRHDTDQVRNRDPERLDPLNLDGVLRETLPLMQGINLLMDRVRAALEKERRFTADAAHEIRTPLAGLKAQAEVALRASDDLERRNALQKIVAAVDRTTHLVNQLLVLARVDSPTSAEFPKAPIDLRALAAEVVSDLAPTAIARGIEMSLADGTASIVGVPELLKVLLRNLIENAIKYGGSAGTILVSTGLDGQGAYLEVTDSGPGIPPGEINHVFDRFFRGSEAQDTGTGLGLSIVRKIAELHQGEVSLIPGPEGKGLRVRVSLQSPSSRIAQADPSHH